MPLYDAFKGLERIFQYQLPANRNERLVRRKAAPALARAMGIATAAGTRAVGDVATAGVRAKGGIAQEKVRGESGRDIARIGEEGAMQRQELISSTRKILRDIMEGGLTKRTGMKEAGATGRRKLIEKGSLTRQYEDKLFGREMADREDLLDSPAISWDYGDVSSAIQEAMPARESEAATPQETLRRTGKKKKKSILEKYQDYYGDLFDD